MGLFRRKRDPAATAPGTSTAWSLTSEIEQLRESLAAMQQRLEDVSTQKAELDAEVRSLQSRLSTPLATPSPASRPAVDQRDLDALRAQLARIESRVVDVDGRVEHVAGWTSTVSDTVGAMDERLATLDARATTVTEQVGALDERVASIDRRVDVVATELANQVTELGGELDALARRQPSEPAAPPEEQAAPPVAAIDQDVVEELIDEVRDAQIRLANEQARYQIAFRQDLAELADRLRRPPP